MKKKQRKINFKSFIPSIAAAIVASVILILLSIALLSPKTQVQSETISAKNVSSEISANGEIDSQNSADLHFQIGGKLTSLPFKEGDTVTAGETIASLDSYTIQQQLQMALNNYKIARDTFDQTQQNSQDNVEQGQQKFILNDENSADLDEITENSVINDMVKRIVDQNQANLDNSVIGVQLANYAFTLSSIQSPINGIITHEDVKVAGQNITPATTFSVKDPNAIVFRAQVADTDIDYVSVGSEADVKLDGDNKTIKGVVVNINPIKTTDPTTGSSYYQVDIQSDQLTGAKFDQSGFVQIQSNTDTSTLLVPSWTVLNGNEIWVEEGSNKVLKSVQTGKTHGDEVEITGGLTPGDKVIVNPEGILTNKYKIL